MPFGAIKQIDQMRKYTHTRFRHPSLLGGLLTFMLLFSLSLSAQDLSVRSLEYVPNDAAAASYETQMQDINGNYAGVVKVYIALDGVQFEGGGVLKQEKRGINEYWVWRAQGSNRLKVLHPSFLPLEVNFRAYEEVKIVKPKLTYKLVITVPVAGAVQQQEDGMRYLAMTVEPKTAMVTVDGDLQSVENGEVVVRLPMGSHRYQVQAPGYAMQEGTVELDDEGKQLSVRLVSTQATLRVECATSGAQLYLNDKHRGALPWNSALMPGNYKVEVRLDGHRSRQENVTLKDGESRTVSIPALDRITGTLNVSCRPIGSEVYVDGQKVGTTPNIFRGITVGQRRVEVRKDGYQTLTQTVAVEENKQTELSGSLTAAATQQATTNTTTSSTSSGSNRTFTVNGVSFTMVYVEGGTFTMGATKEQGSDAQDDEKPAHSVTLSSYYIGETEVTQALWQAVMGTDVRQQRDKVNKEWGIRGEGSNYPMYYISWDECQEFVRRLNSMTGQQFHLPTEAQWEYAARGGSRSRGYKYSGSNAIDNVAWYEENSYKKGQSSPDYGTHPVKTKSPNELGIYDMSGNVWEWCQDWYGSYSSSAQTNPTGPSSGSDRVLRGGSWGDNARICRSSFRFNYTPSIRSYYIGLRLSL